MRNEKIALLKFIDHWIGGPICIFLALFHRVTHPFYKTFLSVPSDSFSPKNILIIKFFGLGSITLASAMVSNIRQQCKDCRIIFLTFKNNVPMIEILSLADEIMTIDTKNPFVLLGTILRTIFLCHKKRIDVVLDIEFYSKFTTIMSYLSGARWRMGFYLARFWRNSLVNIPIYFNYSRHILEIYGQFTSALGIKNINIYPKQIDISKDERHDLQRALLDKNISNLRNVVGLNIHASDLALCRRWPLNKFVTLVERFLFEYERFSIVLTGAKSEKSYSEEFLKLLSPQIRERVIDLTGSLSLKQFLVLLSELPLFITNDTGPFHLAKAVNARTISLWGPGSVDLYGPYQNEKEQHDVVYKRYPCSPCLYIYRTDAGYFCQHKAPCMEEITSEDIMNLVHRHVKV